VSTGAPAVTWPGPTRWASRAWCASEPARQSGLVWVSEDPHEASEARAACTQHCPVRWLCLEWALQAEAGMGVSGRGGVWGGLTPTERDELWRERRAERAQAGSGAR
jgi:hypothetical protein